MYGYIYLHTLAHPEYRHMQLYTNQLKLLTDLVISFKVQAFALFLVTLIITPLIIKYITSWAPAPTP